MQGARIADERTPRQHGNCYVFISTNVDLPSGTAPGRLSACEDIARIERTEILVGQHCAPVFRRLQVQIDQLVDGTAVQEAQDFRDDEGGGDRADEGRADRLACQQRDAAAVELARVQHAGVCRPVLDRLARAVPPPDVGRGPGCRQGVQADGAEVAMTASEPGFDDEVEADLVERLPSETVVETAQRDRRLVRLPPEGSIEQAFVNGRGKAAPFRPYGHSAGLLLSDQRRIGEDRGALGGRRDDIDILQNEAEIGGAGIGQKLERPGQGSPSSAAKNCSSTISPYRRRAAATLARLRALRSDLIDPTIAVHHGRIVKRTGDGSIIEFRSVVDAVRCAVEVQTGMVERNAGLPPERRIEFRVGIHLGDVVEESDGDLMGDGVNIAARLESICEPGAICLSEDAYRQVKGRLELAVSDLGPTQLKNIADPVRVYSVEVGKPAQVRPTKPAAPKQRSTFMPVAAGIVALVVITAGIWLVVRPARGPEVSATTPRLSIVVLPFANLSGDPGQDYLADVLTEGLTTGLSRISGTFVIARSTAFTYKGKPVDVKQVGKDLGVRYVLEGSEQHSGNQVRVNAQLIDAETGAHLWADQFDADRTDLLQMQDEIVTRIARAMQIQLVAVDAARVTRTRPSDLDAEDLALRCEAGMYNSPAGSAEFTAALDLCDRALHIDNGNVFSADRHDPWVHYSGHRSAEPRPAGRHPAGGRTRRAGACHRSEFLRCSLRQSLCLRGARPHPRGGCRGRTQPRSQPQLYQCLRCPLLCKQLSGPAGSCPGAC